MMIVLGIFLMLVAALFLHEFGHYLSARLQGLTIDKYGILLKPVPHFYITFVDNNVPIYKRMWFLLGGSMFIISLFSLFLLSGFNNQYIYYVLVIQIIADTNPLYSDYVKMIILHRLRKHIVTQAVYHKRQAFIDEQVNNITRSYMFSPLWYIHCLLWGVVIVLLLSPRFLNNYL
jgi:membrane-associated protease RseP (regulator of RpoE activity)